MELAGRRVLVVGLGLSGAATARALLDLGAKVKVTESSDGDAIDDRAQELRTAGAEVETGGHDLGGLDGDLAIVSPGIPPDSAVLTALQEAKVPMWSEIELAYRLANCDFLAVTGTNGKTTTTSLLARMLVGSGLESVAAGNIGVPLIEAVGTIPKGGAIAVEVSSFQLALISRFRPRAACILNVAEDHTDWHGSLADYAEAKARITENQGQGDLLVPNMEDATVMRIARSSSAQVTPFSTSVVPEDGIGVAGGEILWRGQTVMPVEEIPLVGRAGLEDVLGAAGTALGYGLPLDAVVAAIRAFRPLRHRMETVAVWNAVTFVDDSKATNPHATLAAVSGSENVVLIAGGRSKGIDLSPLRAIVPPVISVVALGEATEELEDLFRGVVPVEAAADMDEAVRLATARSVPQGSVLLSPGCASLDMYENYAHRGDEFARAVRDLLAERDGDGKEGATTGRAG